VVSRPLFLAKKLEPLLAVLKPAKQCELRNEEINRT